MAYSAVVAVIRVIKGSLPIRVIKGSLPIMSATHTTKGHNGK